MTLFWSLAALLIVVSLWFVLPPLLRRGAAKAGVAAQPLNVAVYRDQQRELEADHRAGAITDAQYERARIELERRLLEDVPVDQATPAVARPESRAAAIIVGFAVPLMAVALYFTVGTPRALAPLALPKDAGKGVTAEQVEAMVAKLAERMKQNPDDPQGWAMLGKSYAVMGRYDDAAAAYGKAAERVPDNPNLLADYADALAMARGQNLQGEPEALVMRALKIDPDHAKSLALAGTVAFEKKDYAGALKYWEKLAPQIPPDTELARNVQSSIAEARGLLGSTGAASGKPAGVSGTVTLAPALKAKAAPGDTVFIFARAAVNNGGPRMPLAIVRKKVSDLPMVFTLDDSTAMSPATRLSGTPQVIIGARISKSGNAMPQPGDLQGVTKPVSNTGKDISIIIDTEVQ
ncbi:MAG: c-type cytochrome biogenesis protein CcmI [Burkholderiales bacterium]